MAAGKYIIRKPIVTVDGVDLTTRASSAEVNSEKDLVDVTSFGAPNKQNLIGLGDGTFSIDFFQDFGDGMVNATLWPIHDENQEVVITIKPFDAAVGPDNPLYQMTGVLPNFTPISGGVGEASTVSAEFSNSGENGIEMLTA